MRSRAPVATQSRAADNRAVAMALVAVAAVLAPMLAIGFVNDDFTIIRFAQHRGVPYLPALFSRAEVIEVYFRPIFDLSLRLDFAAWGWSATGFRLGNLALHLLNSYLVYRLGLALRFDRIAALGALVIFGLHPIHETSLYWIAGRTDVLCATFFLGTLIAASVHIRSRRPAALAAALALCALAMLTKEMALAIPLVVLPIGAWLQEQESPARRALKAVALAWPYAAVVGTILVLRRLALDNDLFGAAGVHQSVPALQLVRNVATYVGLLVIPGGHEAIEAALHEHPGLFAVAIVAAFAGLAAACARWWRSLGSVMVCAAAMLLAMLPVLRLMMRWYLYIPSIFFALGLGVLLARLNRGSMRRAQVAIAAIAIVYAAIDLTAIDAWVAAGDLAGRLGAQLRHVAPGVRDGDTLRFAVIPGKLRGAPVFNLGFEGTVQHLLGRDSLTVLYATKLTMARYPTRVETSVAGDTVTVKAADGDSFGLTAPEIVAQRRTADAGELIGSALGELRVLSVAHAGRPTRVSLRPAPALQEANALTFDGERFVSLRPGAR